MSVAAYNRGSRIIAREADARMPAARARAEQQARGDEVSALRATVAELEHELARARRCLAAERYARAKREAELKTELQSAAFGISVLCRCAFPADHASTGAARPHPTQGEAT